MKSRYTGFTLIELMITIAIIGILASIAVPSYGKYVRESRRTDGHIALRAQAQKMERCRTQSFSYDTCKMTPDKQQSPSGYYNYYIKESNKTATHYELLAQPIGSQQSDSACSLLSLNAQGVTTPEECW